MGGRGGARAGAFGVEAALGASRSSRAGYGCGAEGQEGYDEIEADDDDDDDDDAEAAVRRLAARSPR